jgi:hypothetical protein
MLCTIVVRLFGTELMRSGVRYSCGNLWADVSVDASLVFVMKSGSACLQDSVSIPPVMRYGICSLLVLQV